MTTDNSTSDRSSSRRRFLMLSGIAGAAAFAGCSSKKPTKGGTQQANASGGSSSAGGSGTGTSSGGKSGNSGKSGSDIMTLPSRYVPTNTEWNSYAPSNYATDSGHFVFDPFLRYNFKTNEIIPYLFDSWSMNGKKLTVKLRDGETWHDGSNVTSKDVITKFQIDKGFDYQIANYVDTAKAVDKQTVEYALKDAYRKKVILNVLSQTWMDTPSSKYGKFAKRFKNASSDNETQKIQGDVQKYQPKQPLGSGIFKFDSADQQNLVLKKYDDHPDADNVKFSTIHYKHYSSNQQEWAAMKNDSGLSAYTGYTPQEVIKTYPDNVREYNISRVNGMALAFNHDDEDFKNRNVRRAIAYVIDQNKMAKLADPSKHAVTVPAGVGSFINGTWKKNLGGDVSVYDQYNDTSKAEKLLKAEGYTKKGGKWYNPNGKQFKLKIPAPGGWDDIVSFCNMIAQMLTKFGIETQNNNVENTAFFGQYWGPSNFKICPWFWNNSGHTTPFFTLSWILTSGTIRSTLNYPEKPEVPPMGKPDGKATPQDVGAKLSELATTTDKQKDTQLTRELAWIVNQSLPELPLIEKVHPLFWNTNHWDVPSKDTKKQFVEWPDYWWPRKGLVSPKSS